MLVCNRDGIGYKFMIRDDKNNVMKTIDIKGNNELTEIGDSDWEAIKKQYGHTYPIKDEIIFTAKNLTEIKAKTKDLKQDLIGQEQVDTSKRRNVSTQKFVEGEEA